MDIQTEIKGKIADALKAHEIKHHLVSSQLLTHKLVCKLKCDMTAFFALSDAIMDKLKAAEPLIPTDPTDATAFALMLSILETEQFVDKLKCQFKECLKDADMRLLVAEQLISDVRLHLDAALQLADQIQDVAVKALVLEAQPLAIEIMYRLWQLEDHVEDHLYDIRKALSEAETVTSSAQLKSALVALQSHVADVHILVDDARFAAALKDIDLLIADTKAAELLAERLQEFDAKVKIVSAEVEESALKAAVQKRAMQS